MTLAIETTDLRKSFGDTRAFVDPATMPGWMQTVVSLNPVTHLTEASRGLMHGDADGGDIAWVLVASALVTVVFAPIAMRMYNRER